MELKDLSNYSTALLLLFVVVINLAVAALVSRLDLFVQSDLYSYGLVYNIGWVVPYWYDAKMFWALLGGASAFAAAAIVPQCMHRRKIRRLATLTGFFLPIFAFVFQGIGLFYLNQKNSLVWNTLRDYGVEYEATWTTAYNLFSMPVVVLMVIALLALTIPAIYAAGYEIHIIRN